MLRSTKAQMLLVLTLGAAIGYAAASGKLSQFQKVQAALTGGSSVVEKAGTSSSQPVDTPPCCSSGASKGELLAMADPVVVAQATARAQAEG